MQYEQSIAHCISFMKNFQTIYFNTIRFYWILVNFMGFIAQ
jgi:hypothetical protein